MYNFPQVGFVGQVAYGMMADSEVARRQLSALDALAFCAGGGMKMATGMGQVSRLGDTA
jgi:CRISPR/Cas system endoribonuclease Cas6 (RAMP superfamily)